MNMNKMKVWALVIISVVVAMGCDGCDDTLGTKEIYLGTLTLAGSYTAPIYSLGLSAAEGATALNKVQTGFAAALPGNRDSVASGITKIVVEPGNAVSCSSTGVVSIGINCTANWDDIITARIKPALGIAQMRAPATAANAPATAGNAPATAGNAPATAGNAPATAGNAPATAANAPATAANLPAAAANLPAAAANLPAAAASLPAAAFA